MTVNSSVDFNPSSSRIGPHTWVYFGRFRMVENSFLKLVSSLDSYHIFFRTSTYVSVLPGKLYYTRLGV